MAGQINLMHDIKTNDLQKNNQQKPNNYMYKRSERTRNPEKNPEDQEGSPLKLAGAFSSQSW